MRKAVKKHTRPMGSKNLPKQSLVYLGVRVTPNSAYLEKDFSHLTALRAYQDMEFFDENSQVRLAKKHRVWMEYFFLREAKGEVAGHIKCISPAARKILSAKLNKDQVDALAPYWTPKERIKWWEYLKENIPTKLRNRTIRFRGVEIQQGIIFQLPSNLKAISKIAKPGEDFYASARRITREASRKAA